MRDSRRSWIPSALLLATLPVLAGGGEDVPLLDWPAPPYWQAPFRGNDVASDAPSFSGREGNDPEALPSGPLSFVAITPCRVVDTRGGAPITGGAFAAGETRTYDLDSAPAPCNNIPAGAKAYSLNFTVVSPTAPGYLSAYPAGPAPNPLTSVLNFVAGDVIANASVVAASDTGAIHVYAGSAAFHLIVDVNGYYSPVTGYVPTTGGTMTGELAVTPAAGLRGLYVNGNRSAPVAFTAPVVELVNSNASSTTAPALRLHNNSPVGVSTDGVLSVSSSGSGLLARFGNFSTWVAQLDVNGGFQTNGVVTSSGVSTGPITASTVTATSVSTGTVTASGNVTTSANAVVGGNVAATGNVFGLNMPGAEVFSFQTQIGDPVAPGGNIDVASPNPTVSLPTTGVLLVNAMVSLDFVSNGYSGSFCAVVDLLDGSNNVLTTTREQFQITNRGATSSTVHWAATNQPAGNRTFKLRVTNCMTGTAVSIYAFDRTLTATYLPFRY